jgi:hypothetical protein
MRALDDPPAGGSAASGSGAGAVASHAGHVPHSSPVIPSVAPVDPYEAMLALAGHELSLARDGRLQEICELAPTWARVTSELPPQPPARAQASLRGTVELQQRTHDELLARREEMLEELQRTTHASRAANGYARVTQQMGSRVDRNA